MPRFHIDQPLTDHASLNLPTDIAHHAFRVLRLPVGANISLWNGDGREWPARIAGTERQASAQLGAAVTPATELRSRIHLVQALPEGDKMDWIVEKCTEAGISAAHPVQAQRSVVRLHGDRALRRQAHWLKIALAAASQCGRAALPELGAIQTLRDYAEHFARQPKDPSRLCLLPTPGPHPRLPTMSSSMLRPTDIYLAIGPEGGWTNDEIATLTRIGFRPVSLGPRVYRTETAGLLAISQLIALFSLDPV
ncbi:MAG: 16S rRNA (uracil(1498)-N(3))-methyltransferase [Burkholderiaceae bacterium]